MKVLAVVAVALAFAFVLGAIVWTLAQGAARRARDRAVAILDRDGIAATRWASANLLGSTTMRVQIRGVGVLALTDATLEFRLGYGRTALSMPLAAIRSVTTGKQFRIPRRFVRYRSPIVLTVVWHDDATGTEHTAGFGLRDAAEWHAALAAVTG